MQTIYHCLRNANSREQPGCGHQAAKCEIFRIIMRAELDAKRAICVIINLGRAFANWPCLISTCTGCLVWRLFPGLLVARMPPKKAGCPNPHHRICRRLGLLIASVPGCQDFSSHCKVLSSELIDMSRLMHELRRG